MASRGLTAKQARFVAEYLVDSNATRAAIRAGYSKKTAAWIGQDLLSKTHVAEAVAKKQGKLASKLEVTAERVVAEYAKIAFSDMKRVARFGPDGISLLPQEEIAPDDSACIAELGETRNKDGGSIRFKLHDKKGALDSLARHLGLFKDKPGLDGEGGPDPFATLANLLARQLTAAGTTGRGGGSSGGGASSGT